MNKIFTIICNECETEQKLTDLINNIDKTPNILVDITFEDLENFQEDNIIFKCLKCYNTFEF